MSRAAPLSGRSATVENSDTAIRDPVLLSADVNALNARRTTLAWIPTEPDSSRTMWMSRPHAATRSGLSIGIALSGGTAAARPVGMATMITMTKMTACLTPRSMASSGSGPNHPQRVNRSKLCFLVKRT